MKRGFPFIVIFLLILFFSSVYSKITENRNSRITEIALDLNDGILEEKNSLTSGIISLPSSINFGNRRVQSTNLKYLRIENQGSAPIIISSWLTTKQDYYVETAFPITIPAGSFRNIKVWFRPNSVGVISDTLILINNSSNMPEAKVLCTGVGEIQNLPLGQPIWTHTIPNHPISNTFRTVKGVRAINDINNDGKVDVIVCTENYWTVALNGNSSGTNDTLWSFNTFISNSSAGSIGSAGDYSYQKALSIASDLNNDGFNDVVIGTGGGNETVYAINGKTGAMLWKFGTDHPDSFSLGDMTGVDATTDFNGDGVPDVIAASSATQTGGVGGRRTVYLFNGVNGQIIWQYLINGFTHGVTAIRDVNDDNIPDVIATVGEPQHKFVALSGANGSLLWSFSVPSSTGGAKEVIRFPISSTQEDVIAGAFWGPVYRLRGTNGGLVWQISTGNSAPTQLKVLPDVTGDGIPEIAMSLLGSGGGGRCINGATGEIIWSKSTGNTMGVDVIPDLNGDGSYDVVFAVQNQGALIVNGSNGNDLALYSFGGTTQAREVAIVPDVDDNGSTEVIVGSNLGNVALISGGIVITRTLQLTSPNGGEIWYRGQTRQIRWTSTNVNNVKIELSTNNGSSWIIIKSSIPAAAGLYEWQVGDFPSEQCRIKISSVEEPSLFDISDGTFSIRSQLCVNFSVQENWNLVSVPVLKSNMSRTELFPSSISSAYSFDQSIGYYSIDTLQNGKGYWLKFPQLQPFTMCGLPVENKIVQVRSGWNLIGGFDSDLSVSAITTQPPNILQSNFFGYNNGYFIASSIDRGKGYWIKVSQDGNLIFPNVLSKESEKRPIFDFSDLGLILISDNSNNHAKLYLSDKPKLENYELPPLPPKNIFDVRFEKDRFIASINEENTIFIQGASYPVKIKSSKYNLILEDASGTVAKNLSANEEFVIDDSQINLLKVKVVHSMSENITLYQNYPNPFNPNTKIMFELPEKSYVKIVVYNTLGEEVSVLVNGELSAGKHSINFNASGLAEGVYLYKLIAGDFVDVKKMMVLK